MCVRKIAAGMNNRIVFKAKLPRKVEWLRDKNIVRRRVRRRVRLHDRFGSQPADVVTVQSLVCC